jgi:hypothetical protein
MSTTRLRGKAIQAGYDWSLKITFSGDTSPEFANDATFAAHVRKTPESPEIMASLTTANEGVVRVDDHTIVLTIAGTVSVNWLTDNNASRNVFIDIVRTDETPDVHLGFRMQVPVVRPITRLS